MPSEDIENGSASFDRAWEDTLILSIRDLQWNTYIRGIYPQLTTFNFQVLKERPVIQSPLLKLDGNAESAVGDFTMRDGERYFIFEAKADEEAFKTEAKKPLYQMMRLLLTQAGKNNSPSYAKFQDLSKRGHFVVYPEVNIKQLDYFDENKEITKIPIQVRYFPYLEGVRVLEKSANTTSVAKNNFTDISTFQAAASIGLAGHEMAAYIDFLRGTHEGFADVDGKGVSYPMKAVLCGDMGFCLQFFDMKSLLLLTKLFGGRVGAANAVQDTLEFAKIQMTGKMKGYRVELENQKKLDAEEKVSNSTQGNIVIGNGGHS